MQVGYRGIMRLVLSVFYFVAGLLHLVEPAGFVLIVPSFVPLPETIVAITGILEISGAAALLTKRFRYAAGVGLAAYAFCVFPANINHAISGISVGGGLPTSWWYHGPRFLLQPLLVWWALYCAEVTNWPDRSKRSTP
jgi:uncharacterized membrane protein